MILFFQSPNDLIYAVQAIHPIHRTEIDKLIWLFGEAKPINSDKVEGKFAGPRKEMITPWSTNAVEITLNMGIHGIKRIEEYHPLADGARIDPMLQKVYDG